MKPLKKKHVCEDKGIFPILNVGKIMNESEHRLYIVYLLNELKM